LPYTTLFRSQKEAVQAIQLLSDASRGKANFFVLDAIQAVKTKPQTPENTIPALEVVKVDKKYNVLCEQLLQHVFILKPEASDSLEEALLNGDLVILHPEGKFSKNRLGLYGGSVGLFEGKRIGWSTNQESLTKEIKELYQKI